MNGTNCLVQVVCNVVLSGYGDIYIGVMTVVNSVREIASLPVSGVSNGSQPVLGYNYGAGRMDRVKRALAFSIKVCTIILTAAAVIGLIFAPQIVALFRNDPTVVAIGGLNARSILQLQGSGAAGAAVVSGIFGAPDITAACRELRALADTMVQGGPPYRKEHL